MSKLSTLLSGYALLGAAASGNMGSYAELSNQMNRQTKIAGTTYYAPPKKQVSASGAKIKPNGKRKSRKGKRD